MVSGSRGDFTGAGDIDSCYSADEVLYGALPDFEAACRREGPLYGICPAKDGTLLLHAADFPGGEGGFQKSGDSEAIKEQQNERQ